MRIKTTMQSIVLQFFLVVIFTIPTAPMAMSGMTLNDNVNIGGDIFLEGDGCGINFPDGSYQTTGAITPWNQKISEGRFVLVLDDEAVFDRETGLVWQRDTADDTGCNWDTAQNSCYEIEIGGRLGWRLPTIDELATLIDRTQSNPALPEGHFLLMSEDSTGRLLITLEFPVHFVLNQSQASSTGALRQLITMYALFVPGDEINCYDGLYFEVKL